LSKASSTTALAMNAFFVIIVYPPDDAYSSTTPTVEIEEAIG